MASHTQTIIDQFTKQAVPFATAPSIRDEQALRLLVEFTGTGPADSVLDVACGPGLVVTAFARVASRATGIDVTPAMIERARDHQRACGLDNVDWRIGDILPLPYPDGAFSVVVCRFAFHHFPDPLAVLREMARVAAPSGKVVVADVTASPDPVRAAAFNAMEKLRDPSHARALPLVELRQLFADAGLAAPRETFYDLPSDLDGLLARSFPAPADVPVIRAMIEGSVPDDGLGMKTQRVDGQIRMVYPIAILVSDLPATKPDGTSPGAGREPYLWRRVIPPPGSGV